MLRPAQRINWYQQSAAITTYPSTECKITAEEVFKLLDDGRTQIRIFAVSSAVQFLTMQISAPSYYAV